MMPRSKSYHHLFIDGCNHKNICYAKITMLTVDSEGEVKQLLDKVIYKSKKKGLLTLDCNKREGIGFQQKGQPSR